MVFAHPWDNLFMLIPFSILMLIEQYHCYNPHLSGASTVQLPNLTELNLASASVELHLHIIFFNNLPVSQLSPRVCYHLCVMLLHKEASFLTILNANYATRDLMQLAAVHPYSRFTAFSCSFAEPCRQSSLCKVSLQLAVITPIQG